MSPCPVCLNSAIGTWCTWKCNPKWNKDRHLVAGSFANIRGCKKLTLTVLTNCKRLTLAYMSVWGVVLVSWFFWMSGGHLHCEFSTFNKKAACSWSYSDWMEMEWGWRHELQVQMDIFCRHLPDAVEAKKIPDIININLMIIQEGIASQLQVLRVDEVFKAPLKCTDWVAH